MLFRLARPMFRKNSSIPYFVQRIPTDVQPLARGLNLSIPVGDGYVSRRVTDKAVVVKVSLGTREPTEAKKRQGQISSYLEGVWQSLREDVKILSHKQTVSLAGEVYKAFTAAFENNPGSPEMWREVKAVDDLAKSGSFGVGAIAIGEEARLKLSLEKRFGGFVDGVLARRGLRIDSVSRMRLLVQVTEAMELAADTLERYGEGDYSPDTIRERYPEWRQPNEVRNVEGEVSINGLLEGWWKEASRDGGRAESTLESYAKAIRYFVEFLGHDDARRVTSRDVVGYKDKRLVDVSPRTGKPISTRTINDSELAGIRTVFKWGVKQHLIPSNPAEKVSLQVNKAKASRAKGFTEEEAVAILRKCLHHKKSKQEGEKTAWAKRWVPWLCAYTGARVGEIVQLRKEDVVRKADHWILHISPEAFTLKNGHFREVPLHPHLVEQGFIEFVNALPDGYIFVRLNAKGSIRGSWRTMKNRLGEFARTVVNDARVKPNHGWRHRFITLSRRHDLSQELRRMITGHKGQGVDELDYGDPEGLYREICKLPPYDVK